MGGRDVGGGGNSWPSLRSKERCLECRQTGRLVYEGEITAERYHSYYS